MSIEIMTTVWKFAPVHAGDLLILLALADFADDSGACFPSVATLAARGRMTTRNVQICLKSLAARRLIVIERAVGPKGANRYHVQADFMRTAQARGENISPVKNDAKGVKPISPGGETHFTQTIKEPSIEPSLREGAREGKRDFSEPLPRGAGDTAFRRAFAAWPTFATDSEQTAKSAWQALDPAERLEAAARAGDYVEAARQNGRTKICGFAVYLREKRWERLPDKDDPADPAIISAPPFGPAWAAQRMIYLIDGPVRAMAKPSAFIAAMIAEGGQKGERARREHVRNFGFPHIRQLDHAAEFGRGCHVAARIADLAAAMEAVPVGSATFKAWEREFEERAWPWIPPPGRMPVVYFPKGGPEKLDHFTKAAKEAKSDDGGKGEENQADGSGGSRPQKIDKGERAGRRRA